MRQSRALSNPQIARAALVVLLGFLASGLLGLVRTAVIAAAFGTGEALDAFVAAQRIPEALFVLVAGGALGSSFIPVFSRLRAENSDETSAWQLASAVMTLAALAAVFLGGLVIVLAPWFVPLLESGKSAEQQALTTSLTQLMMITPVIFSVSGLLMGILHAHQNFLLPSLAISMNNIGLIVGALVIAPLLPADPGVAQVEDVNAYGLAYGAILSAVLHLLVQLPGLRKVRAHLRFLPDWRIPGVIEVLRLMGPRVLGLAVVQVNFFVNIVLTSGMIDGSRAALTTAFTLMFFALGIIGQSVGSAVFPSLSALAAENDMDGFKARLSSAMRGVLFLSFPATVGLIVLGEAIVSLFERDQWTAESTAATAWALAFYATGIAGFSLLEVLSRAFYALEDTKTPVIVGTMAMLSNIVLSLVFIQFIGDPASLAHGPFAGLALANALTTLFEGLALWWLMRRRIGALGTIGGINDRHILGGAWRALTASLGMGIVIWLLGQALAEASRPVSALVGVMVGGGVFFGLSLILGIDEAKAVPIMILHRIRR